MFTSLRLLKRKGNTFRFHNRGRAKYSNKSKCFYRSVETKRTTSLLPFVLALPFIKSMIDKKDEGILSS